MILLAVDSEAMALPSGTDNACLDDRLMHLVGSAWIQKMLFYLLGLAMPGPAGRLMRLVGSALVQKMWLYLLGLAQPGGAGRLVPTK